MYLARVPPDPFGVRLERNASHHFDFAHVNTRMSSSATPFFDHNLLFQQGYECDSSEGLS
jgi:hypothetical protein